MLPVRITELSVTEESFSADLDPIRAKVSLGLRVLGVNDVPRAHRAAALAMAHHRAVEGFAAADPGKLGSLGLGGLP